MSSLRTAAGRARTLAAALAISWRACPAAIVGQTLVAVLIGLSPVAAAWLLRAVLDGLISGGRHDRAGLLLLAAGLAAAGAITGLLPNINQYLCAQSGRAAQREATAALFTSVTRLAGLRRLEDPAFQDRLRVAQQSGASGPGQIVTGGIGILQAALTLMGFLVTLAVLSPVMAAVVLVAAVPAIYLQRGVAKRQVAFITGVSHGQRRQYFYANLLVSLAAAKEIRLFGLGIFFRGRMLHELREVQKAGQRVDRRTLLANAGLAGIGAVVTAGGLLWAVLEAVDGRLTVGDVTVFVTALASVASALEVITSEAAMTYQALLMFASYQQVLAEEPDLPVPPDPVRVTSLRRGLELDDVWFRYGPDDPWILRGVSCFIPRGQALAVVGHNGAGKSTLVKLLCRLYDPGRGRILWDGVDVRELDLAGLRDRISVVFQDFMNYDLSATENIAVGDLRLAGDGDQVSAAAQRAGIHQALAALPKGYDTLLTRTYFDLSDLEDPQTGVLLSGGQWQRVALARAFLRGGRDLMILDEPSSGLDAEAEHQIHAGLAATRRNCATVLVSHRLNTIRDADHIVVLSDGVIGEQGTHDALMARPGIYARLFSLQARGFAERTTTGSSRD
jgi:ATP-binding cassette, subfamily B, bacterial